MNQAGKMKRVRTIVITAALVVVIGLLVYRDVSKGVSVRVAEVAEGPLEAYVEERAYTSLPNTYHITMPMQGRILPIELAEGDMVTNGQVVANLEETDWLDTREQVDQMVRAMESAVKAASAQIKANEARTEFTKWVRDTLKTTAEGAVSEQDRRKSEWEYLDSVVKTEESTASYYAMDAFLAMTRIFQPYVERNLARTQVISPVDGVILKRHVWNEKVMTPGSPVLDIGDLEKLEVTAEVLSEEAVRIQPGDRVVIFGEAVGEEPLRGAVRRIEPEAFSKLSSLGVEQQRVKVRIVFDPEESAAAEAAGWTVGLNYRVRTRIVTDAKEEAVLIPRTALFRGEDGGWATYLVDKGRARLTPLRIGLSNDFEAEVVEGLKPGDIVIDAPESAIGEGVRVVVSR